MYLLSNIRKGLLAAELSLSRALITALLARSSARMIVSSIMLTDLLRFFRSMSTSNLAKIGNLLCTVSWPEVLVKVSTALFVMRLAKLISFSKRLSPLSANKLDFNFMVSISFTSWLPKAIAVKRAM